jgi:hypothetical protein
MDEETRRDDSAEGGALDDEGEGGRIPGPMQEDPVESGALEEDRSDPDEAE